MANTAPAWEVRDIQRQKFVDKMVQMVQEADEEMREKDAFFMEDVVILLFCILARRRHGSRTRYAELFTGRLSLFAVGISRGMEVEAEKFGRADEEINLVLWRVVEKLSEPIQSHVIGDMNKKQMFETRLILGVDSGMEEIEIPD